jgi:hypothetical protein
VVRPSVTNGTEIVESEVMKKLSIICALFISLSVWAEDSIVVVQRLNILESMPRVEVVQDASVAAMLEVTMSGKEEWIEVDGYRVQIYSSNRQQTAKSEALELEDRLKEKVGQTIYVQYLPPFWKVRLGDFREYEEAKEYKKEFVQQFPDLIGDTYIVRDKIKVLQ